MRIPKSEFTDADLKLCRAHGASVAHGRVMTASQPHDDAEWSRRWERAEAIAAFETEICMPADLPLPPSYWDDLEHWLKTLVPAKPASPKPEPTADVWHSEAPSVAGVYIASAFRDGNRLRWFDGRKWHQDVSRKSSAAEARCSVESTSYQSRVQWLRLIEADAPAKPLPSASSFASTSSAVDGAALVGAKLTHSVCIKAHNFTTVVDYQVGEVIPVRHESIPSYRECWIPCVEDGWIPHAAGDGCPVPVGVGCQLQLRSRTVLVDISREIDFRSYGYWAECGDETITHWRPIAQDAS